MEGSLTAGDNVALATSRHDHSSGHERGKGSKCCSKFTSIICSNLGVCFLVLIYTALGALLFTSLEGHHTYPAYHHNIHHEEPIMSAGKMALDNRLNDGDSPTPSLISNKEEATSKQTNKDGARQTSSGASETSTGAAAAVVFAGSIDTQQLRHQTVERLWSITESLNILYRENWTRVVEIELRRYSQELVTNLITQHNLFTEDEAAASRKRHGSVRYQDRMRNEEQWTFAGSFLYSLTVITTIGYGDVAPQTSLGKIVTILYALVGLPLMLLYLSSVGDILSKFLKWIWHKMCYCRKKKPQAKLASPGPIGMPGPFTNVEGSKGQWSHECHNSENGPVPMTLCFVILLIYICGGAAIFSQTHDWSYVNALFFCFSSMATIGFGDLKPSSHPQNTAIAQLQLLGTAIYLLVGMALIATCFNLMQEHVTSRGGGSTAIGRKLGSLVTTPTPHQRFHLDDT